MCKQHIENCTSLSNKTVTLFFRHIGGNPSNFKIICSCMNGKRRQRNDGQSADRHQIDNREARKKKRKEILNVEVYCVVPCSQFRLVSFREYKLKVGEREVTLKSDRVPVTRYTKKVHG